jgi:hypothetical protein
MRAMMAKSLSTEVPMLISQLSAVTSLSAGDNLVIQSAANNDARKASLSVLLAYIEANFASPDFTTEINAPTSSGFNLQMVATTHNMWMIINPTGAFAAGTLTLPPVASCFDGQQIVVTCSAAIAAFTVAGNGATVTGPPTSLGTGGFFALRFNALQDTWYCVSQSLGSTDVFTSVTITAILDTNGNEILKFVGIPSAVNELTIFNGATGDGPGIAATGSDTDINIDLIPKGAGVVLAGGNEVLTDAVNATGTALRVLSSNPSITFAELTCGIDMAGSFASIDAFRALYEASKDATGMRATCNDAGTTRALGVAGNITVVGGGANVVPIWYDGTNWKY